MVHLLLEQFDRICLSMYEEMIQYALHIYIVLGHHMVHHLTEGYMHISSTIGLGNKGTFNIVGVWTLYGRASDLDICYAFPFMKGKDSIRTRVCGSLWIQCNISFSKEDTLKAALHLCRGGFDGLPNLQKLDSLFLIMLLRELI